MKNSEIIKQFKKTWFYTRKITNEFLHAIPEDKWHYTHDIKYATLAKQFRHMTCVYGVYIDGFKNQAVDFSKKHSYYTGPLEKISIQNDLFKKDAELKEVFKNLTEAEIENFKLDFFGVSMTFTEYSHLLVQHECMHIGIWSCAASHAGFELPQIMKDEWGF